LQQGEKLANLVVAWCCAIGNAVSLSVSTAVLSMRVVDFVGISIQHYDDVIVKLKGHPGLLV
jgi:hypothetical protein